jgi:hypothetical protein
MKAHHGGSEGFQHIRGRGAEWRSRRPGRRIGHGNSEFLEIRRQQFPPGCFPVGVRLRHGVAEEIDVEGPLGLRSHGRQLGPHLLETEQGAG